ncbi:hypothetical protein HP564_01950 [Pantoea sp. KPR_PJ]
MSRSSLATPRRGTAGRAARRRHHAFPEKDGSGGAPRPQAATGRCHGEPAAWSTQPWLEHFEWLNPLFNEQPELRDGRRWISDRAGRGFSLSVRARSWTVLTSEVGARL